MLAGDQSGALKARLFHLPRLDGILDDEPLDEDLLLLAEPVNAVVRLRLCRVVPRYIPIHQHKVHAMHRDGHSLYDAVRRDKVQAESTALRARRACE